jgi:hypothetical protein
MDASSERSVLYSGLETDYIEIEGERYPTFLSVEQYQSLSPKLRSDYPSLINQYEDNLSLNIDGHSFISRRTQIISKIFQEISDRYGEHIEICELIEQSKVLLREIEGIVPTFELTNFTTNTLDHELKGNPYIIYGWMASGEKDITNIVTEYLERTVSRFKGIIEDGRAEFAIRITDLIDQRVETEGGVVRMGVDGFDFRVTKRIQPHIASLMVDAQNRMTIGNLLTTLFQNVKFYTKDLSLKSPRTTVDMTQKPNGNISLTVTNEGFIDDDRVAYLNNKYQEKYLGSKIQRIDTDARNNASNSKALLTFSESMPIIVSGGEDWFWMQAEIPYSFIFDPTKPDFSLINNPPEA